MSLKPWILAARPKTLPAAASPVLVGCALAYHKGLFSIVPALLCLGFALLIQIATNYANDYFDFKKGADNSERKGPARAVASGLVSPRNMLIATVLVLILAFLVGINLVTYGGLSLLIVGLLSLAFAVLYTGGPYPLAYLGLGDVFVLIFFGWVAVMFTYMVQAGVHSFDAFLLGTTVGLLSVNLLVINNYRDYDSDRKARKWTTIARFGLTYGRWQYRIAAITATLATAIVAYRLESIALFICSLISLIALKIAQSLKTTENVDEFNRALKRTVGVLLAQSISISVVLIIL